MKINQIFHNKPILITVLTGLYYITITAQGLAFPISIIIRHIEHLPVSTWEYFLSGQLLALTIILVLCGKYLFKINSPNDRNNIVDRIEYYNFVSQNLPSPRAEYLNSDNRYKAKFRLRSSNINYPEYTIMTPRNMRYPQLDDRHIFPQSSYGKFEAGNLESAAFRISYWTERLIVEVEENYLRNSNFDRQDISFGFLNVKKDNYDNDEANFHFGVILSTDPSDPLFLEEYETSYFRNLPRHGPFIVDVLELAGVKFPVFVRPFRKVQHCDHPQPIFGTKTCMALPTKSNQSIGLGFITAKHAIGSVVGGKVILECGHVGYLADVAEGGIDAAFIICPNCTEKVRKQIFTQPRVAPWTKVTIHTKHGPLYTMITDTNDRMGLYNMPQIPIHHFLADHALPGDSGALITDRDTSEAIGIYLGAFQDIANRTGGFAIHAHQVSQVMSLNFYQ